MKVFFYILLFEVSCLHYFILLLQGCEREVAEAKKDESGDRINESIMRLSWALVHSRQPEDVQRGIAMLEGEI